MVCFAALSDGSSFFFFPFLACFRALVVPLLLGACSFVEMRRFRCVVIAFLYVGGVPVATREVWEAKLWFLCSQRTRVRVVGNLSIWQSMPYKVLTFIWKSISYSMLYAINLVLSYPIRIEVGIVDVGITVWSSQNLITLKLDISETCIVRYGAGAGWFMC